MTGKGEQARDRIVPAVEPLTRAGRWVLHSTTATPPRVYTLVSLALALLFSLTTVFAGRFHTARHDRAREHYVAGMTLARTRQYDAAIARLRASLSLQRDDTATQLALATTLLDAGRPREAGAYLVDVLRTQPASGRANLVRARISRALGVADDAERHYLRAIYGEWPVDGGRQRLEVRFELAAFLLDGGNRQRARAELSAIAAEARGDVAMARRLARLFLQAQAPDLAATELRTITGRQPDDAQAWTLLSDAEFALGRYADTVLHAERALQLDPSSAVAADRLRQASEILGLDPTTRRLRSVERERRARLLLERMVTLVDACVGSVGDTNQPLAEARARAAARLAAAPKRSADAADAALDDTEVLWRLTRTSCLDAGERDPILAAVMAQILDREAR